MRILIVEDDVAGRFVLQNFLKPLGAINQSSDVESAVQDFNRNCGGLVNGAVKSTNSRR